MAGNRTYERIELNDSAATIAYKLSEGNPGALSVIVRICKEAPELELGTPLGVMQFLLAIDSAGLFGPKLWLLYKDLCGRDLRLLLFVLRGFDFGVVSAARLHLEVETPSEDFPLDAIMEAVRKRCPRFGERKEAA